MICPALRVARSASATTWPIPICCRRRYSARGFRASRQRFLRRYAAVADTPDIFCLMQAASRNAGRMSGEASGFVPGDHFSNSSRLRRGSIPAALRRGCGLSLDFRNPRNSVQAPNSHGLRLRGHDRKRFRVVLGHRFVLHVRSARHSRPFCERPGSNRKYSIVRGSAYMRSTDNQNFTVQHRRRLSAARRNQWVGFRPAMTLPR